ncbi:unnamed protein product [Allacma fusca]|uniref:Peptidase aspartic putative domain-containing protein n=1 Tax=Allacma fusca TaxID=39272 RepID=A0A8J2J2N4_9HEXA|nr:unnamed protein product [Allacma fusca]
MVNAIDNMGNPLIARAFLDNCSDAIFVESSFVSQLGLARRKLQEPVEIGGLEDVQVSMVTEAVDLNLTSRHFPGSHIQIIRSMILRGQDSEPIAQESVFGWLVAGGEIKQKQQLTYYNLTTSSSDTELRKFWELESTVEATKALTVEERTCERHFQSTTTRLEDGFYQVRLPFKENKPSMGDSKRQALSRFYNLETKLERNPQQKCLYVSFMEDVHSSGYMEESNEASDKGTDDSNFLPHHGVLKMSSSTTKLRVVFDGSAKSTSGYSLNDQL